LLTVFLFIFTYVQSNTFLHIILMAVILFQAMFIFLQYVIFKRVEYLYYIVYIFAMGIFLYFQQEGQFGFTEITKNNPTVKSLLAAPVILFAFGTYIQFGQKFLEITNERKVFKIIIFLKTFLFIETILFFVLIAFGVPRNIQDMTFDFTVPVLSALSIWIIILLLKEKNLLNNFLIGGALFITIGGTIGSMINLFGNTVNGINPSIMLPLEIAVFFELVLLNTGLIYKTRLIEQNIIVSQQKLIAEYKLNEELQHKMQGIRQNISKDLHDEVGATLSGIKIFSQLAVDRPEESVKYLDKIKNYSEDMISKMSDIVWSINPLNDSFEIVMNRLQQMAETLAFVKNINIVFSIDAELKKAIVDMQKRKNIYLIAKEAINNAIKYASCKTIKIVLLKENERTVLKIADDGIGIEKWQSKEGNGLRNMKERSKDIGAVFTIDTAINKGTVITVAF
jgi:signal transduction histidine kinase